LTARTLTVPTVAFSWAFKTGIFASSGGSWPIALKNPFLEINGFGNQLIAFKKFHE